MLRPSLHPLASVAALACAAGVAVAVPPTNPQYPTDPGIGNVDPDMLVRSLLRGMQAPEAFGPGGTAVVLQAPLCTNGAQFVVEIKLTNAAEDVVGGQFFLTYDKTLLDFDSAAVGDAPFTQPIYSSVNESLGEIDYAVGVPGGGPGTDADTVMARFTFNVLGETCYDDTLVDFRAHTPPTRITNELGQEVASSFVDLGAVSLDQTNPLITCPPAISLYADAGFCTATLNFVEPFDATVPICPVGTPDCWEVDRYAPDIFENALFMGENVLRHGVDVSDSAANRPSGYSSTFYNYQGYKRAVAMPTGTVLSAEVWIPSSWSGGADRHASLWGETYEAGGYISGYPILAFTGNPDMTGTPMFRAFVQDTDLDPGNGLTPGWLDLDTVTAFDRWYRFEIELTSAAYEFRVIDLTTNMEVASLNDPITFGSLRFGYAFLQLYNYGETYETYWDNVNLGPDGPIVSDCNATLAYERSDNPLLTLTDPFPAGATTTITWTATDDCGNESSCTQDVIVDGSSLLDVVVELSPTMDPGPFTRCITFEFAEPGCAGTVPVSAEMTFVGGLASGLVEVPCGEYVCVTARDELHTLQRDDLDDFGISGTMYVADFTGGDALIGGNLNDDAYIDILDFGTLVGEWSASYGTGGTTCATPAPNADIDSDGVVDTADFTFIGINFLALAENGCCVPFNGSVVRRGPAGRLEAVAHGPIRRIAVSELKRLGLAHLAVADLTHDGWLDIDDIAAFIGGARP